MATVGVKGLRFCGKTAGVTGGDSGDDGCDDVMY